MVKFWKRDSDAPAASDGGLDRSAPSAPSGDRASDLETSAIDELASILRVWGQYAFDLDDIESVAIREQLERWRRHVLSATPLEAAADQTDPDSSVGRRDWPGLRDFVRRIRCGEHAYVNRQVLGTRQVMSDFLETLGQVLVDDREEQGRVLSVLNALRRTIEGNAPIETLSQEAVRAIDLISGITRERSKRHECLLRDLTQKLQSMRGELEAAQREMELDPLTRLYNRKAFDIQLERVFELSKLSGQCACLLMADADHFKLINDQHGHQVGDTVLRRIADCCAQTFPRKTDFVSRYGGEEIAIVLQDTPLETALLLAGRLLDTVRAMRIPQESGELGVTLSIGLAASGPHESPGQWLRAADTALYAAKEGGRDRISSLKSPR